MGIPEENGTTFSDKTGPTNWNGSCHFQILLPDSLIRAKNRFVKNGTANFGRNIPTEICGPPPEVIPNIPVRRNRNGPFHLNSNLNFWNLWHNGKHPIYKLQLSIWLVDLNNFECDWVIQLCDNKLSNNKVSDKHLASELVENRNHNEGNCTVYD